MQAELNCEDIRSPLFDGIFPWASVAPEILVVILKENTSRLMSETI
jgi:hypothetical protein